MSVNSSRALQPSTVRPRDEGRPALLDGLRQDLRYAARTLRRDAAFTWFATLIVGLGIGASATVFSVANAVLIRPLPFRDPGSARVDHQSEQQRVVGSDDAGGKLPGPARAERVVFGCRRVFRLLRRWRQQAHRNRSAGASERRPGLSEFLSAARRGADDWQAVHRGRVSKQRTQGRHVEPQRVAAALRVRSLDRRPTAHIERSGGHRRRRAAADL